MELEELKKSHSGLENRYRELLASSSESKKKLEDLVEEEVELINKNLAGNVFVFTLG